MMTIFGKIVHMCKGKFPEDPERIFALLREGLRAGAEWVDVEACWPVHYVGEWLREWVSG